MVYCAVHALIVGPNTLILHEAVAHLNCSISLKKLCIVPACKAPANKHFPACALGSAGTGDLENIHLRQIAPSGDENDTAGGHGSTRL